MAKKPVGQLYVELDLDSTKYTKGQKAILAGAEKNSADINRVMKTVGTQSDAMYNAMRKNIQNALEAIKRSHLSSHDEIRRAKEGAAAKIKAIDDQQYGHQTGLLTKLKENWIALAAAAYAAMRVIRAGWNLMEQAADYKERINSLDALGKQYGLTGDQIVRSMKDAARGLMSLKEASDLAATAINLALTPIQMIEFTKVAEKLTDVIGGTIPEAYNRLIVAAASGRTMTLAQMGIIVDLNAAYKKYGDNLTEVQKQQIRLNVILDAAKQKTDALGESVDTDRDRMDRFTSKIADLKLEIGKLTTSLTPLIQKTTEAIQGFEMLFGMGDVAKLSRRRTAIIQELEIVERNLSEFQEKAVGIDWMDNIFGSEEELHKRRQNLLAELEQLSIALNKPKLGIQTTMLGVGPPPLPAIDKEMEKLEEQAALMMAKSQETLLEKTAMEKFMENDLTEALYDMRQKRLEDQTGFAQGALDLRQWEADAHLQIVQMQAEEERRIEEYKNKAKTQSMMNWAQTGMNIMAAVQVFTGKESKIIFAMAKGLEVAKATMAAFAASTMALASPPGPPWTIPLSHAVLAMGLANAAAIAATAFGEMKSAGGAGGAIIPASVPSAPVPYASPIPAAEQAGGRPTFTVIIEGDFIGDESYIEMLMERMSEAVEGRDVRLIATSSKFAEALT